MAVTGKITIGRGVALADACRNAALNLQQARRQLVDAFTTLEQYKIQDGGSISTFTANALGAATPDDAQALYDEMNSLQGKIDNPNSGANVQAVKEGIDQLVNKIR